MPDFRQQYKENPFGFHGAKERRMLRAESKKRASRNQRSNAFNRNRNIKHLGGNTSQVQGASGEQPQKEDRLVRLQRWKMEKERQRRKEQVKKKPPFTVGVVHHKLYSPASKDDTLSANIKPKVNVNAAPTLRPAKKITKATEKRLKLKAMQEALKQQAANTAKVKVQKPRQVKQSIAPDDYKFTAPAGLYELPLFGKSIITNVQEHIRNFALSPPKRRFSKRTSIFQLETTRGDENASPRSNLPKAKTQSPRKSSSKLKKESNSSLQEKTVLNNTTSILNTTFEKTDPLNTTDKSKGILNASLNEQTPKANSSGDPALFSPYIVSSRGKSRARKEEQLRRGLGMSPVDGIPTKATVIQQRLNTSIEDEGKTAQYFCFLLNKESERLRELCGQWEAIKSKAEVTEDAQYQINQAIGQTNLLLNKKFESFRKLIHDCESGKGEMLVTCKDLEGFWDMMYREVKDCDTRFQKLEKSRSENWVEEKPEVTKPITRKKTVAKKKVVVSKPSGIRALIMAARKEKMLSSSQTNSDKSEPSSNASALKMKSPAVRNYTRKSLNSSLARSKPAKSESARKSLVQQVRLSESSKKVRSPLAIMKISKMCRTPTVELKRYPNQEQTPAKSILKKSKDTKDLDCSVRSNYKVNFDDNVTLNEVEVDEEVQTKLDLAAALERIESFDFDTSREQVELAVERKLNFDSDSSDESEDILDKLEKQEEELNKSRSFYEKDVKPPVALEEAASPKVTEAKATSRKITRRQNTVPAIVEDSRSPLATKELLDNRNINSGRRSRLRRTNAVEEESTEDEHNESIRILRNRTISTLEPPRTPRRKSSTIAPTSEQKENTTPSRRRRRNSLKPPIKVEQHSKMDLEAAMHLISLNEHVAEKPRRSTRFSIKYSDDCTGCAIQKPRFPVTPHVRRSQVKTSEKKRRGTFSAYTLPT